MLVIVIDREDEMYLERDVTGNLNFLHTSLILISYVEREAARVGSRYLRQCWANDSYPSR